MIVGNVTLVGASDLHEEPHCLWCGVPCPRQPKGKPRNFCCNEHRVAFRALSARWATRAAASGLLSLADLRRDPRESLVRKSGL